MIGIDDQTLRYLELVSGLEGDAAVKRWCEMTECPSKSAKTREEVWAAQIKRAAENAARHYAGADMGGMWRGL
jgi:hypothetical protein